VPFRGVASLFPFFLSYDDLIAPNGSRPGGLFPVPGQVLLRGRSTLVRLLWSDDNIRIC
jgi:hypothetical protein